MKSTTCQSLSKTLFWNVKSREDEDVVVVHVGIAAAAAESQINVNEQHAADVGRMVLEVSCNMYDYSSELPAVSTASTLPHAHIHIHTLFYSSSTILLVTHLHTLYIQTYIHTLYIHTCIHTYSILYIHTHSIHTYTGDTLPSKYT